jgi:hypothetical protein
MAKPMLSFDAFKRRLERKNKDKKWAEDVARYKRWKSLYDTYKSDLAKEMMEKIQAEWPSHSLE